MPPEKEKTIEEPSGEISFRLEQEPANVFIDKQMRHDSAKSRDNIAFVPQNKRGKKKEVKEHGGRQSKDIN